MELSTLDLNQKTLTLSIVGNFDAHAAAKPKFTLMS